MADVRKLKDKAAEAVARGKLEKAADLLRQALKGDPREVATHQKLAEVLRRAGHIDEAIEEYQAVADRFAHDGLLIKAIAISKTILELDPEHVDTQLVLADLYAKKAASEKARPPTRTVFMSAVQAPAAPSAPPAVPPRLTESDDRVVAIPLTPHPESPPAASAAPPPIPGAIELPEEDGLPLELLVERPPERPAPAVAAARRAQTGFARIVFAAEAAVEAGVDAEVAEVMEAEPIGDDLEVAVEGDEPLGAVKRAPPAGQRTPPSAPAQPAARAPAPPSPPSRPSAPREAAPTPPPRPAQPLAPPRRELPRVPIFSDLSRDAFVALTSAMVLQRVNEGDVVLREGDTGTSFYVVVTGKLAVSKRDERGEAVVLARLGEGDFFGEMALLSGARRAATVISEEPCELLEFRPDVLLDIAGRHPGLAASLRRFYRQRLLANAMAMSPIFRPFTKADRKLIMERFRAREVADGEIVIHEGEPSDGLYVVLDGAVEVVKRREGAEVVVSHLREGDLFGEMSCLRKAPASASVVVRRGGTLLRLPRREFDDLVSSYPQILELVAELSEERAESLDAILSGHAQWTDEGLVLI